MSSIEPAETLARAHAAHAGTVFWAKSRVLIGRRALRNRLSGEHRRRLERVGRPAEAVPLAEDRRALYWLTDPRERELELGKVQNLRIAAAAIDGLLVPAGETFSFWGAVGRPSRRKGYVVGRELRQGCMIPTVGGGICQLTNALSRVATKAGMEIVERHRHSMRPGGFPVEDETDATVFWNYIDLRFRAPAPVRIGAILDSTDLLVRLDAV